VSVISRISLAALWVLYELYTDKYKRYILASPNEIYPTAVLATIKPPPSFY
jgi:hypothetical protein